MRVLCGSRRLTVVASAWLACWAVQPAPARAFCRTTTCATCPRDPDTRCTVGGAPIAWPSSCVSFSMQDAASLQVDLETATRSMREAFATWESAHCGEDGKPPSIHVSDGFGSASCGNPEYNRQAGNANVVMFRDTVWPYASSSGDPLGQTTLTADDNGVI
jgi:hypothetical protein